MKYLTKTTSALFLAGCAALFSGCDSNNAGQSGIKYIPDEIAPSAADTSDQTMYQPKEDVDIEGINKLADNYDATHAKAAQAAPVKQAVKPAAPPVDPPLAAKEDIAAAKERVSKLRGSVKTAKNGAITGIVVESADATLDDMKLFARLLDLESIQFLGANFTDEFLAEFKDLKKINNITIQNSEITGATLNMFATYPELKTLDIRHNLKVENNDLAAVAQMPKIEKLSLYYNNFRNTAMKKFQDSPTLKYLDLRACQNVDDSVARYLIVMPALEELHFRFGISDDGVERMAEVKNLKFVEFQDCTITDRSADFLVNYPALTGMRVFRCKSFADEGVKKMAERKLDRLELRDLNVSSDGVLPLKDMTSLRAVELSELNSVDAAALNTVCAAWKDLESLYLFSMSTDDGVVKTIADNMKNLKSLTVRASVGQLTDASIDAILGLQNLETLDLRENAGLTVDGMMKLAQLKSLRKIYIKGTALGDSSAEVKAKIDEFKKINPKCAFSN